MRGSPWVVPGAVAVMFLANELDPDAERVSPFVGLLSQNVVLSPTFAFGLVFFTAATGLVLELMRGRERPPPGAWILLALLFAGAMGAKASALAVLLGGLALLFAGTLVLERRVDRTATTALAIGVGAFVVVYLLLFSGAGATAGAELDPFAFRESTVLMGSFSASLISVVATAAVTAGLIAPWLGALLLARRLEPGEGVAVLWLGGLVLAAAAPFVVFSQTGLAQVYFLLYACPPAALLSAWGVSRAWPALRVSRRPFWCSRGWWFSRGGRGPVHSRPHAGHRGQHAGPVLVPTSCSSRLSPRWRSPWSGVSRRPWRWPSPASLHLARGRPARRGLQLGRPAIERRAGIRGRRGDGPRGIDKPMLAGLRWLRDHSDEDDVVATSTADVTRATRAPSMWPPTAERRTFLGGSDYTSTAFRHKDEGAPGVPFAHRPRSTRRPSRATPRPSGACATTTASGTWCSTCCTARRSRRSTPA